MARHAGSRAEVRLAAKRDGRRRFQGVITAVSEDRLRLQVDGELVDLPLDAIESARLVPEL
jgi:ribosome maturation factor RimP